MERAATESLSWNCPQDKINELKWQHRNSQVSAVGDLEAWSQHDVLARLNEVQCPMLVIRGDDDFWVPRELADEAAEALPNSEMVHLPNIGHYPMFEDPALIADLITDFCTEHGVINATDQVSAA
jgi:pimeloyl-ACP methyl ester carboxylesterase